MAGLPEDKLAQLEKRFDSVEAALSAGPGAEEYVRLSKEYAELEPVVRPIKAQMVAVRSVGKPRWLGERALANPFEHAARERATELVETSE